MTRRSRLGGVLCCVALAGCTGSTPSAVAPSAVAPGAAANSTPAAPEMSKLSARFIGFVGPQIQHDPPFLGVDFTNFYCLRSFLDRRNGETVHQLYVADSYFGAERDWDAARDAAGRPLPFTQISTNKITCEKGCAYDEEFAATLPEAELRSSTQGLSVTFSARSGNTMTIALSGASIARQLAAVDAVRAHLPARAAATPPP